MSKRQDPNSPMAIVVWVNSESEIELVQQRDVCVHGPLGEAGKVVAQDIPVRGSEDRLWVQGDLVGKSEVWLTMDSKLQLQNEDNVHSIESRGE